mgnify:CR=1 FL=1
MTSFWVLLTRVMVLLVLAIFVVNLVLQRNPIDSALFSLALAVGLTPQLLPAIVSISLAQGARRMAARRVIVRRLDAIEDFGSMTVLCSDKTGTMTEGRIELGAALSNDGVESARVAELASLNAGLQRGLKNPIDLAILSVHPLPERATAVAELPYDFQRKRVGVLVRQDQGGLLVVKGAFEQVLAVCDHASTTGGAVPLDVVRDGVRARFEALSGAGYRVLGLAIKRLTDGTRVNPSDEAHMTLVGLLTFADRVKPDAATTLEDLAHNRAPMQVALVMDCSGSMYGSNIRQARKAASSFVERTLAPHHRITVIAFPGGVKTPPTNDAAQIEAAIKRLRPIGSTPMRWPGTGPAGATPPPSPPCATTTAPRSSSTSPMTPPTSAKPSPARRWCSTGPMV